MGLVVGGEVEKECLSQFVVKALCVIIMILSFSLWAVAVWFLRQVSVGTSCVLLRRMLCHYWEDCLEGSKVRDR